jgi:hypothetical protein
MIVCTEQSIMRYHAGMVCVTVETYVPVPGAGVVQADVDRISLEGDQWLTPS